MEQWDTGTKGQRENWTMRQWDNGATVVTMGQWDNRTIGHWCTLGHWDNGTIRQ